MRIGVVSFNNIAGDLRSHKKKLPFANFSQPLDTFTKTQPSFGSVTPDLLFEKALRLRQIQNLPSAYDDLQMISLKNFGRNFAKENISNDFKKELKKLNFFRKNMYETERKVVDCINNSPEAKNANNLQDAMKILFPEHISILRIEQLKIMGEIKKISKNLPRCDKKLLYRSTRRAYKLIKNTDGKNLFKRKTFLNGLERSLPEVQNKILFRKIFETAQKLPTSENNVSSFVVKYSRRSPIEIEQRLVSQSIATFDHGIAKDLGGENVAQNVFIVSARSNSKKTNDDFFLWYTKNETIVKKNAKKQINYLIAESNKQSLKNIAWYIIALKNSFLKLTKGQLNLDISKLNPSKTEWEIIQDILKTCPETFGLNADQAKFISLNPTQLLNK